MGRTVFTLVIAAGGLIPAQSLQMRTFDSDMSLMENRHNVSNTSPGPGWWLASDGNWYPSESHPNYGQQPSGSPCPSDEVGTRVPKTNLAGALLIVAVAVVITLVVLTHALHGGESASYKDGYNTAQEQSAGMTELASGPTAQCDLWASRNEVPTGDVGSEWIQGCAAYLQAHGTFLHVSQ